MKDKVIEIEKEEDTEDKQEKFECECIKCGYKMTSDKHCNEIKCPKCGGQLRRVGRPGPGQASFENLEKEYEEIIIELYRREHQER